jgi:hypothetical protein
VGAEGGVGLRIMTHPVGAGHGGGGPLVYPSLEGGNGRAPAAPNAKNGDNAAGCRVPCRRPRSLHNGTCFIQERSKPHLAIAAITRRSIRSSE